jgi:hypothetical protein
MMRDTHGGMTKRQVLVEIPVALQLTTERSFGLTPVRSDKGHFAAHMRQLQELIESMKRYSEDVAGVASEEMDRGHVQTAASFARIVRA